MTLGKLLFNMYVNGPVAIVRDVSLGCNKLPEIYYEADADGWIEECHPELLGCEVYGICVGNHRSINWPYMEIALENWDGLE